MGNEQQALFAVIRSEFGYFVRKVFEAINPGEAYIHGVYIDAIAFQLTRLLAGENTRLVINLLPRHLKSIIASVAFSAWILGHMPTMKLLCVSYSPDLAIAFSKMVRTVMESPWYCQLFPGTVLSATDNTQDLITTTAGGSRRAVSMGGAITGFGADLIILDDPQKADDVQYPAKRQQAIDTFRFTLATRLNDQTTGRIVVIQQRLHEEDLSGALLESGAWVHLSLAAIAECTQTIELGKGKFYTRQPDDVLHPERLPKAELDKIRAEIGSLAFATQYQQQPAVPGGDIAPWKLFGIYDNAPAIEPGDMLVQSWDVATGTALNNDFSVCTTWLYKNYCLYLLQVLRKKMDYPALNRFVRRFANIEAADVLIIEANGIGAALYSDMLNPRAAQFVFKDVAKDSKELRLMQVLPLIECGRVLIPCEAPWLQDFRCEWTNFPNGKHDDQVDSATQALRWLRFKNLPPPSE